MNKNFCVISHVYFVNRLATIFSILFERVWEVCEITVKTGKSLSAWISVIYLFV